MNVKKLKAAEAQFFMRYPEGWDSEELQPIMKRHKVGKMEERAQSVLSFPALEQELTAMDAITKLIASSSLVSVFEKVKFKNLIKESDELFRRDVVGAIRTMLHEDEEAGFTRLVGLLAPYKMAKWPIITALLTYYKPHEHVVVKPTTVKRIIQEYDLEGLTYSPKMNYPFYNAYRQRLIQMTKQVDPHLSITNGHFSGFLMMTFE